MRAKDKRFAGRRDRPLRCILDCAPDGVECVAGDEGLRLGPALGEGKAFLAEEDLHEPGCKSHGTISSTPKFDLMKRTFSTQFP